ncbi:hypothetical protein DTO271G3_3120 [Paecilomyces variotii]|nr:hypothetical protein DTO271G3_3120 [Paecilomyces variotii]
MTQIARLRYPLLPPLRILDSFHLRATAAIAAVAARLHTIMSYSVARAHCEAASSNSSNAADPSPVPAPVPIHSSSSCTSLYPPRPCMERHSKKEDTGGLGFGLSLGTL